MFYFVTSFLDLPMFIACSLVQVMFRGFLYFSILVMLFKCSLCILIYECICLFLSSMVGSSLFDTWWLLLIASSPFCLVGCSVSMFASFFSCIFVHNLIGSWLKLKQVIG